MIRKVKAIIEKYNLIDKNDKVLIGVSGGPDSITLLNILYKLGYNICTAHINHGIRESADDDEKFVVNFCEERNISCFVKKVKLKEIESDMTLEELGRKIRYDYFKEISLQEGCNKIATAHNANDNAETVLMNIIRGSGMAGLKGIEISRGNIIRPLLEITRKEIEEYCDGEVLNPCHDETNDEVIYTRNKVRLELIPYIENNINSNIVNNINRMSEIISENEEYITKQTDIYYRECLTYEEENRLLCNLKKFNEYEIAIRKRLIIRFISKVLGNVKDIEKIHIEDILKLCKNNVGGKYLTPNKNIKITVNKGIAEYLKL